MNDPEIDALTAMGLTGECTDAEAERFAAKLTMELNLEYAEARDLVQDRRWELEDWAREAVTLPPAENVLIHPWTTYEELGVAAEYFGESLCGDTEGARYQRIDAAMWNLRRELRAVYADTRLEDELAEALTFGANGEGGLNRLINPETTDAEIDLLAAGAEAAHGGPLDWLREDLADVRSRLLRGDGRDSDGPLRFYRRANYAKKGASK